MKKKTLAWAAVALYALLIFIGSSIPGNKVQLDFPGLDKLLHTIEYSVLSALLFTALRLTLSQRLTILFWIAASGASLYGVSDEVHQIFVPLRNFDVLDISCDVAGSFLGSYLVFRSAE